jgi:hypothetical protein
MKGFRRLVLNLIACIYLRKVKGGPKTWSLPPRHEALRIVNIAEDKVIFDSGATALPPQTQTDSQAMTLPNAGDAGTPTKKRSYSRIASDPCSIEQGMLARDACKALSVFI